MYDSRFRFAVICIKNSKRVSKIYIKVHVHLIKEENKENLSQWMQEAESKEIDKRQTQYNANNHYNEHKKYISIFVNGNWINTTIKREASIPYLLTVSTSFLEEASPQNCSTKRLWFPQLRLACLYLLRTCSRFWTWSGFLDNSQLKEVQEPSFSSQTHLYLLGVPISALQWKSILQLYKDLILQWIL